MTTLAALADAGSVFSPDWLSLVLFAALLGYTAVVAWIAVTVERERGHLCVLCHAPIDTDVCPSCAAHLRAAFRHGEGKR